MIKTIKRAFVLGMTSLILFAGLPATTVYAADSAPVHTKATLSGKDSDPVVTYEVALDKTRVTDGRLAVTYDPEVLTLVKAKGNVNFEEKDFNKDYKDGERAGASYAFVHDAGKYVKGDLITLTFKVKVGLEKQDTVLRAEVFQLSDGDKDVVSDLQLEDVVEVGRPELKAPQNVTLSQSVLGVEVKWDEDPAADGFTVYRSDSKDGEYRVIGSSKTNSFTNVWINKNRTYYYKVVAYQQYEKNEKVYSEASEPVSIKVQGVIATILGN